MIKISTYRSEGNRQLHDDIVSEKTPGKALDYLISCEIAFGGNVTDISDTKITIVTPITGMVDHTVFEGSSEEMRSLTIAIGVSSALRANKKIADAGIDSAMRFTEGNPRLIAIGGAMFMLGPVVSGTIKYMLANYLLLEQFGDCVPENSAIEKALATSVLKAPLRNKDGLAALTLHLDDGVPMSECLALLE